MPPRPRIPRRVVAIAAAGGLAVAALGLTGCDYPAGPGSSIVTTFNGCGDTTSVVIGCTKDATISDVTIKRRDGRNAEVDDAGFAVWQGGSLKSISQDEKNSRGTVTFFSLFSWGPVPPAADIWVEAEGIETYLFHRDTYFFRQIVRARAPVPAPSASLFSHDSPAAKGPAPVVPTIVDARQSTGTGLTYSWDTNGDGTFGDAPQGGWTGVAPPAAGTAYLPTSVTLATSVSPRVKVTDTDGKTSTQTISIATWAEGAGGLGVAAPDGLSEQITLTPDIGTLPRLQSGTPSDRPPAPDYACIDVGNDGTYETDPPLPFQGVFDWNPTGFSGINVNKWAGAKLVRVTFFRASPTDISQITCAAPAADATLMSTHIEMVNGDTKQTMERGGRTVAKAKPKAYAAKARVRVTGGALIAPGTQEGTSVKGVVNRGRYSLKAPAKGGGAVRPAAVAAFAKGDFASTSDATLSFTADGQPYLVGTTTMVIRGSKKALACFRVAQTDTSTIWTMTGGTGAARTLRMGLTGGPTLNSAVTAAVPEGTKVTGKGASASMALKPVSISYGINASKGAGRGISSACRALVKRLP